MLHKLPPEILDMVAQSVTSKQDLKSLALVSRAVHRGVQRTMWSSLDLWPIEEDELWHFNWKPVFHKRLPAFLIPTELNFYSNISSPQGERCPHWRDEESPPDSRLHVDSRFGGLALMAESIVDILPPRRLRKFTWGLGSCVPGGVLGRSGALAHRQPQLASLDLTTVGNCLIRDEIDLSHFRKLTEFRWRGPRMDDFDAITDVLKTNREHLTTLELDFIDWDRLRDQISYEPELDAIEGVVMDRYFHTNIMSIGPQTILEKPLFPALVSLSLSSVPLLGRTARAFDFTTLQSLTIRKCSHWNRFLAEIPKVGAPVRLKTLEVHQQYEPQVARDTVMTSEHEALLRFITSFTGLEELFLSLIGPIDAMALWNKVVKRHGTTLKRFSHHLCAPEDNGPPVVASNNMNSIGTPINIVSEIYDIPDFDLAPKLRQLSHENPLRNIYRPESIGLSCIPEVLGPMFSSFAQTHANNSSLKLIHVRQSRSMDGDGDWTPTRDRGSDHTILLPTSYNNDFQTGARYPVSLQESIYGSKFTVTGEQQRSSQKEQQDERNELEVDWAKEAERIAELAQQGSPLVQYPDNGSSSVNNSRQPSPSLNHSPHSPATCHPQESALRQALLRFAKWAFGPQGIPSLEVIAFGDFAHGRWACEQELGNIFLVKNRNKEDTGCFGNFSIFWPGLEKGPGAAHRQKSGYYLTGRAKADAVIERNRRFLEACPMEPLIDYDMSWPGPYRYMS